MEINIDKIPQSYEGLSALAKQIRGEGLYLRTETGNLLVVMLEGLANAHVHIEALQLQITDAYQDHIYVLERRQKAIADMLSAGHVDAARLAYIMSDEFAKEGRLVVKPE